MADVGSVRRDRRANAAQLILNSPALTGKERTQRGSRAVVRQSRRKDRGRTANADAVALPGTLVGSEKEHSVSLDWAAQREAKRLLLENTSGLSRAIAEKVVGVELVIAQELESRAMKIVAPAPRYNVDVSPGVAAESSVVQAGLHLELLDSVGIGNGNASGKKAARLAVVDRQAIHLEVVVASERSVCARSVSNVRAAGTAPYLGGIVHLRRDASRQTNDLRKVARRQRQIGDLRLICDAPQRARFCLQQCSLSGNRHHLLHSSQIEHYIEPRRLCNIDLNTSLNRKLETSPGEFDAIGVRQQQL